MSKIEQFQLHLDAAGEGFKDNGTALIAAAIAFEAVEDIASARRAIVEFRGEHEALLESMPGRKNPHSKILVTVGDYLNNREKEIKRGLTPGELTGQIEFGAWRK